MSDKSCKKFVSSCVFKGLETRKFITFLTITLNCSDISEMDFKYHTHTHTHIGTSIPLPVKTFIMVLQYLDT